ncbi:MAG: ATP-binding protein [Acidaminobacteraceae bacterium]
MLMYFRNLSIAKKLFLYLFLVSFIPLSIYGTLSYFESKNVLLNMIDDTSRQIIVQKNKYLDATMSEIENLITNITKVEDIKDVLSNSEDTISDYDRLATQAKIGYILSGYSNIEGLVSIDIFAESGQHFYVGDTLDIEEINLQEKNRIINVLKTSSKSIVWLGVEDNVNMKSKSKRVIIVAKAINVNDSETMQKVNVGFILVSYDVDVFYNNFKDENQNTIFVVLDRENRIVYHPDISMVGETINLDLYNQFEDDAGTLVTTVDNIDMSVSYQKLKNRSWLIVSYTTISSIESKLFEIQSHVGYVILFSIGFILFFAFFLSRTFVQPIKNITYSFQKINSRTFEFNTRLKVSTSDEIGELSKWFNRFAEVYEEKEIAKRELIKSKEAAESANIAKSRFLANMSHEIRTPINGIKGFLELLELSDPTKSQRELIQDGKTVTDILIYLINDILDFSKIEAGKLEMESIEFNLRRAIEDSVSLLLAKASEKNIRLFSLIDKNVPEYVVGDPSRLKQILMNLISNAVKFTKKGEVFVKVTWIGDMQNKQHILFEIKDTGIGIKENEVGKLFQSFNQADSSTTRKYGGTGLGLAISKELINMMNGEIVIESVYGQGSTFKFDIIFDKESTLNRTREIDATMFNNETNNKLMNFEKMDDINILLVEDNAMNRKIVVAIFKKYGLTCDIAVNGLEAIDAIKITDYDIIFMDCQMPVMDGYESTARIRAIEGDNKHTTIVAMTANAMEGDRIKCIEAGMDDYIKKPLDFDKVRALIVKSKKVEETKDNDK